MPVSQCDGRRSDSRFARGTEYEVEPAAMPSQSRLERERKSRASAADPIWVCSAVVSLTAAEIVAALCAFSDLMDDVPEPSPAVLRDELSFVISRYGTVAIDCAAKCIATGNARPVPRYLNAVRERLDSCKSKARLDWCRTHVALVFGGEGS